MALMAFDKASYTFISRSLDSNNAERRLVEASLGENATSVKREKDCPQGINAFAAVTSF